MPDTFEWIGWLATAIFAASYLCKQPAPLRRVQALAAVLWVGYGTVIHALPVVVANLIVAGAALYSSFKFGARPAESNPERAPGPG